jgi:membrane dipeptidase
MRATQALSLAVLAAGLFAGCRQADHRGAEPSAAAAAAETTAERAARMAQEILIVDTHVDVPYRLLEEWEDISVRTEKGDFDFPRAKAGGLNAPFMSIYVPASLQESGGAKEKADELIRMVEKFTTDWPDKFALARSPADLEEHFAAGKISLPMGMENGAPIEDDLANVAYFFDRGIRYVTLTHSKNNQICDSSYEPADNRRWGGLSPFGREVVAEMNRLGIMIDVSHISDPAVDQVLELSAAPVIASHSSCRKFTPGFERNLDDERIRRLGENGGVIQINFGSAFLTQAANEHSRAQWEAFGEYLKAHQLERESEEAQAFMESYRQQHPLPFAELSDVVAHIDHVVELAGVDHVGLGSDFDGVGDSLPAGLKDVSGYPNLIAALLERGYSEEDVRKICGGNLIRVWTEVERIAAELQAGGA